MPRRSYEDRYWEEPRHGLITWFFWIVFRAPGKVILWWEYMYPKRGQVYASGRRYGNPTVEVITSIGFWFAIAYGALLLTHPRTNMLPPRYINSSSPSLLTQQYQPFDARQSEPSQSIPPAALSVHPPEEINPPDVAPDQIVVATAFANLRVAPSKTAGVIDQVNANEQLFLIKSQGNWAEVRRENGIAGWIHRTLISPAR